MKVKSENEVTQSCPTLSDPMDCSLPGSSVHGIFQARVLEWGAIAFSNEQLHDSAIPLLGMHSKNMKIRTQILKRQFHYSISHSNQKVETARVCQQIHKIWYIQKSRILFIHKRNVSKVLIHAKTWINRENMMLSEISQTQKDKYCLIPLTWNIETSQILRESRPEVTKG